MGVEVGLPAIGVGSGGCDAPAVFPDVHLVGGEAPDGGGLGGCDGPVGVAKLLGGGVGLGVGLGLEFAEPG